jgi:hypothetical protein
MAAAVCVSRVGRSRVRPGWSGLGVTGHRGRGPFVASLSGLHGLRRARLNAEPPPLVRHPHGPSPPRVRQPEGRPDRLVSLRAPPP